MEKGSSRRSVEPPNNQGAAGFSLREASNGSIPPVLGEDPSIQTKLSRPLKSHRRSVLRTMVQMNSILCRDSLELLQEQADGTLDLIYIDPPFCTGKERTQGSTASSYSDSWGGGLDAYLSFLRPRLEHMNRVLKSTGTICVHLDWHAVHHVKVLMDELFGYDSFLNEIIWHYRTGGVSKRWFGRKHDTILIYAKHRGHHTFNVQRGGEFRTDGLKIDEDGRPYKSTRKGRLYFHQDGPAVTDVWDIPFLSTVSLERVGYPSQKPETLLRRIIAACSNEGDLVADFFCGSGTTLVVAQEMGRRYLGCDVNPEAITITCERLGEKPPKIDARVLVRAPTTY